MKGADQVFARRKVDTRLASHRTVDHGEQGRRDLIKRDATKIRCGRKTCQITGDSTSNGKKNTRPVDLLPGKKIPKISQAIDRLGRLPRRRRKTRGSRSELMAKIRVCLDQTLIEDGHDLSTLTENPASFLQQQVTQVGTNRDGISSIPQPDLQLPVFAFLHLQLHSCFS